MNKEGVPLHLHSEYLRWVRFYLDFCQKYAHPPREEKSIPLFLAKLAGKHQSGTALEAAAGAVQLLIRRGRPSTAGVLAHGATAETQVHASPKPDAKPLGERQKEGVSWEREFQDLEGAIKLRNYSKKTFEVYRMWVQKFQAFTRSKHPEAFC